MQELYGTARVPGVAMAVPVVVGVTDGLSGVPSSVLRSGLKALKQGLADADLPEVIVVCDLLSIGAVIRIPGVRVIGIAAQGSDEPSLPITVPCVTGISDLLMQFRGAQVMIVDGTNGMVIADPDVASVVRYQSMTDPAPTERVFLEGAHLAACTQDGRAINVAALVSSIEEIEFAISEGADSLIVRFFELTKDVIERDSAGYQDPAVEAMETLLVMAAGKPVVVVGTAQNEDLFVVANRFGGGHVTFASDCEQPEAMSDEEMCSAVISGSQQVVVSPQAVGQAKNLIRTLPGSSD